MVVSWISVFAVEISKKYEVKFEYILARCLNNHTIILTPSTLWYMNDVKYQYSPSTVKK